MPESIKKHKFNITVGTFVGLIVFIIASAFTSGINISSAESAIYERINANTANDKLLENSIQTQTERLETHVNYSYTIKADLKKDIEKTNEKVDRNDEKLDKIYNLMIASGR